MIGYEHTNAQRYLSASTIIYEDMKPTFHQMQPYPTTTKTMVVPYLVAPGGNKSA